MSNDFGDVRRCLHNRFAAAVGNGGHQHRHAETHRYARSTDACGSNRGAHPQLSNLGSNVPLDIDDHSRVHCVFSLC